MYAFFDLIIDSVVPLPELGNAVPENEDLQRVSFSIWDGALCWDPDTDWHEYSENADGVTTIAYGRNGSDYLLRFPGVADFRANLQQSSIHCSPDPGVALSTVRHLLQDQVLPRFVGQSGRLIVHASAVAHRSQAIMFIGRSGWRKSTLAAFFADGTQRQFSDDVVLLQMEHKSRARAVTSYQGMRLWPDAVRALFDREPRSEVVAHYSDKKRLFLPEVAHAGETSLPLRAMFVLYDPANEESRDIIIRPLHGVDAIMALVRRTFMLDPHEMGPVQKIFKCAGDVVRTAAPLSWLGYPRVHEELARVKTAVLEFTDSQRFVPGTAPQGAQRETAP